MIGQSEDQLSLDIDRLTTQYPRTTWKVLPAGAQHRNGLPEAMVQQVTKALCRSIPSGDYLTYPERVTLTAKISNSINSRPLGVHKYSQGSGESVPLTVNQLLLGKSATPAIPVKHLNNDDIPQRVRYVEQVHQVWWNLWLSKILPTMLPVT